MVELYAVKFLSSFFDVSLPVKRPVQRDFLCSTIYNPFMPFIKQVIATFPICLILHLTARIKGLMNFFGSDFENGLVATSIMLQLFRQYQIEFYCAITDSMYARTVVYIEDQFHFAMEIQSFRPITFLFVKPPVKEFLSLQLSLQISSLMTGAFFVL